MSGKATCVRCTKPNAVPPKRLCWTCDKATTKAKAAERHDAYVVKQYGLKPGQYADLLALQGFVCAICLGGKAGKRLAVDHDHVSGEPRGLLCRSCNYVLLGRIAKDDPERLAAIAANAVAYYHDPPYQRMLRGETHDG